MAPLYLMNLEDRVAIARNQIDLVILRLRSIPAQSRPEEVEQFLRATTSQLQDISELIGR
ncbi:MAG TPA: hypothetical protein VGT40_10865 [Methylomirabilota bacterium]|jgi:hypothetical protein|nr:hypothetical protein [Methylomirabilota bacterium]